MIATREFDNGFAKGKRKIGVYLFGTSGQEKTDPDLENCNGCAYLKLVNGVTCCGIHGDIPLTRGVLGGFKRADDCLKSEKELAEGNHTNIVISLTPEQFEFVKKMVEENKSKMSGMVWSLASRLIK